MSAGGKISRVSLGKAVVMRSRFFSAAFSADDIEQAKIFVAARKKKYPRARHHCWACRIGGVDGQVVEQARDDGEVGRPGHVLLDLLRGADLLGGIVVSRVSGGVKLGPGGVSRAFRQAGELAIAGLQSPEKE
jgi:putative IMPACT (imprinted ancient) family translation regulator